MPRIVKCGLIQCSNAAPTDLPIEDLKRLNIEKHLSFIEQAAAQGVQILGMQEVFTTPYFCAEQQTRWYEAVERIPDGPTVRLLQEVAKEHGMVIIVPIYEEEITGIYYNTAAVIDADGKYEISQKPYSPCNMGSAISRFFSICIDDCGGIVVNARDLLFVNWNDDDHAVFLPTSCSSRTVGPSGIRSTASYQRVCCSAQK